MQEGLEICIRSQFGLKIDITALELRREVRTRNGTLGHCLLLLEGLWRKVNNKGDFGKNHLQISLQKAKSRRGA